MSRFNPLPINTDSVAAAECAASPAFAAPADGGSLRPLAWTDRPPAPVRPSGAPATQSSLSFGATRTQLVTLSLATVALATTLLAAASPPRTPQETPHAAAPAVKTSTTGKVVRWRAEQVVLTLDSSLDATGPWVQYATRSAMAAWMTSGAALPNLVFNVDTGAPGVVAQDGVNRVIAAPITIAGHEHDLAVTITYSDSKSGSILEVDMVFNTAFPYWTAPLDLSTGSGGPMPNDPADGPGKGPGACGAVYDLQNIAAHEFGHFWGLGDDPVETEATMFVQSGPCETLKRDLSPTDIGALEAAYQPEEVAEEPGMACSVSDRPGATTPLGLWGASALAILGLLQLRRRRNGGAARKG